jgi:hypothetical protein
MAAHWNEFRGATLLLVGTGQVKPRLIEAYRRYLAPLREVDLPEPIREPFSRLRAAMHETQAAGGMSSAEASVRKMSEKDAAGHAAGIFEMFASLAALGESESAPRLRIVGGEDQESPDLHDVPAFLSRA